MTPPLARKTLVKDLPLDLATIAPKDPKIKILLLTFLNFLLRAENILKIAKRLVIYLATSKAPTCLQLESC